MNWIRVVLNKRHSYLLAMQVTEQSMEDCHIHSGLWNWCNGRVKGTAYEPSSRVVEFWSDGEHTANLGDWIVQIGAWADGKAMCKAFTDHEFKAIFEPEGTRT